MFIMKCKTKHSRRSVPNVMGKIVEWRTKSILLTHIHDSSLTWLGTDNSVKESGDAKLDWSAQIAPLGEIDAVIQVFSTCE